MRNTITALVFCLLTVLSGAGLLAAAEPQDDEKITAPTPTPTPGTTGPERTIIVPRPPETRPPAKTAPVELPVIPVLPDKTTPVEVPALPVLPDKTAPVEIPVIPVLPQAPDSTTVLTPTPRQETPPHKETLVQPAPSPKPAPPAVLEPDKQQSPLDFLVMPTPLDPGKTQPEAKAEKDKQALPEKDKQPSKARPEQPKAQTPAKPPEPETRTPPKTAQTQPKPGDPLQIPPEAAKTGDLSFLEGCWRGTRPEYSSKRTITERFCFDKNGNGKRTIEDPRYAGKCTGATKGSFDAQGRLIVTSEQGYCTGGARWGQAYMVCQGEGNSTPCFWRFPDAGGGSQSYKIPLVRE